MLGSGALARRLREWASAAGGAGTTTEGHKPIITHHHHPSSSPIIRIFLGATEPELLRKLELLLSERQLLLLAALLLLELPPRSTWSRQFAETAETRTCEAWFGRWELRPGVRQGRSRLRRRVAGVRPQRPLRARAPTAVPVGAAQGLKSACAGRWGQKAHCAEATASMRCSRLNSQAHADQPLTAERRVTPAWTPVGREARLLICACILVLALARGSVEEGSVEEGSVGVCRGQACRRTSPQSVCARPYRVPPSKLQQPGPTAGLRCAPAAALQS